MPMSEEFAGTKMVLKSINNLLNGDQKRYITIDELRQVRKSLNIAIEGFDSRCRRYNHPIDTQT